METGPRRPNPAPHRHRRLAPPRDRRLAPHLNRAPLSTSCDTRRSRSLTPGHGCGPRAAPLRSEDWPPLPQLPSVKSSSVLVVFYLHSSVLLPKWRQTPGRPPLLPLGRARSARPNLARPPCQLDKEMSTLLQRRGAEPVWTPGGAPSDHPVQVPPLFVATVATSPRPLRPRWRGVGLTAEPRFGLQVSQHLSRRKRRSS